MYNQHFFFSRFASWRYQCVNGLPEIQKVHLQVGLYAFFHRLYGMFPCNFLSYLRTQYSDNNKEQQVKSWKTNFIIFFNLILRCYWTIGSVTFAFLTFCCCCCLSGGLCSYDSSDAQFRDDASAPRHSQSGPGEERGPVEEDGTPRRHRRIFQVITWTGYELVPYFFQSRNRPPAVPNPKIWPRGS